MKLLRYHNHEYKTIIPIQHTHKSNTDQPNHNKHLQIVLGITTVKIIIIKTIVPNFIFVIYKNFLNLKLAKKC